MVYKSLKRIGNVHEKSVTLNSESTAVQMYKVIVEFTRLHTKLLFDYSSLFILPLKSKSCLLQSINISCGQIVSCKEQKFTLVALGPHICLPAYQQHTILP
jgi:hypothetical protein